MPCGATIFCVFSLSVRPHISKFMVRFYRAEFSHSLGPWPTPPIRSKASPLIGAHRPCERWSVEGSSLPLMTHICHRSNSGTLNCLCPLPFDADEENEETGPTGNMRTFASTREFALKRCY